MHRVINRRTASLFGVPATIAAALFWIACGTKETPSDTTPATPPPSVTVAASPNRLPGDGKTSADLTITVLDSAGKAATGDVTVKATAGDFTPSDSMKPVANEAVLTLANGKATAKYTCDTAKDDRCDGNIKITATFGTASGTSTIEVDAPVKPDGGEPDAGSGTGDAGTGDGGMVTPSGDLKLTLSKTVVFTGAGDYVDVQAKVSMAENPKDHPIKFATDLGGLVDPAATGTPTPASTLTVSTDSTGVAKARFVETGTRGVATLTATDNQTTAIDVAKIQITNVQQLAWVSTKCSGTDCSVLCIKEACGAGFTDQAQVAFRIVDSDGKPLTDVPVSFQVVLPSPPAAGTRPPTTTATGKTDATGTVVTNFSSGDDIGTFTVQASFSPAGSTTAISATSPTLHVRGTKPANHALVFSCEHKSLPAFVDTSKAVVDNCSVKLIDRFNNPVGTGTQVGFKTEAGNIPASVLTKKFDPAGSNADEGLGNVVFSTAGVLPVDTTPLTKAAVPTLLKDEPADGAGLNPRDGLVTVIAYVRGEEFFNDDNRNGKWDTGETFIDQGEPFIDANDNNKWDPGEVYVDENPKNGVYDAPNKKYDSDTTIWSTFYILYSGGPSADYSNLWQISNGTLAALPGRCGGGMSPGTTISMRLIIADARQNRLAYDATTNVTGTFKHGAFDFTALSPLIDGYGFNFGTFLVDSASSNACTATSARCEYVTKFFNFPSGENYGGGLLNDEPSPATGPQGLCDDGIIKVSTTTGGVTYPLTIGPYIVGQKY